MNYVCPKCSFIKTCTICVISAHVLRHELCVYQVLIYKDMHYMCPWMMPCCGIDMNTRLEDTHLIGIRIKTHTMCDDTMCDDTLCVMTHYVDDTLCVMTHCVWWHTVCDDTLCVMNTLCVMTHYVDDTLCVDTLCVMNIGVIKSRVEAPTQEAYTSKVVLKSAGQYAYGSVCILYVWVELSHTPCRQAPSRWAPQIVCHHT